MYNKIILAGGSGYLGEVLKCYYQNKAKHIIILSRQHAKTSGNISYIKWDGLTMGDWADQLENADLLVNLCGKNVNCRYTPENRKAIIDSRVIPTRLLGQAVGLLQDPPKVWLQCASATIYRHAEDVQQDELRGDIGTGFSVDVCNAWEAAFNELDITPVRKVLLRVSMVMGRNDGVFPRLKNLVLTGLGGHQGTGYQMISWIHELDFARATEWILQHNDMEGVFNITAPVAVNNRKFMKSLRETYGVPFGLPAPQWLLELGASIIGTETELILKSRWVYPQRLLQSGFRFQFQEASHAIHEIASSRV